MLPRLAIEHCGLESEFRKTASNYVVQVPTQNLGRIFQHERWG